MGIMTDREEIPRPSPAKRRPFVVLPTLSELKVSLYAAMRDTGVSRTDLARRLNCPPSQVDRLLDLNHASRFDQLEAAFRVPNKRLSIQMQDAA